LHGFGTSWRPVGPPRRLDRVDGSRETAAARRTFVFPPSLALRIKVAPRSSWKAHRGRLDALDAQAKN